MSGGYEVVIGGRLDLHGVHTVARRGGQVRLAESARAMLADRRARLLADVSLGKTIYGVNTGFGALSDSRIPAERTLELQHNLLRSHAMGVGEPLPPSTVRALMLLRAHTLALGASGVSPELVERIVAFLQAGVVPHVPSQGSVGASGDLAPLAHLALPLIGEGEIWEGTTCVPASAALTRLGVPPFVLGPKEGLALINGTQLTTAVGALATWTAAELLLAADIIGALSLDAGLNSVSAFDPRIHAGKPHAGQERTARLVLQLVDGSALLRSHAGCLEVQDAYCIRCMPQVHGAARAALHYTAAILLTEINSLTDNPLMLAREDGGYDVLSGGNFHAAAVALPLDHMCAALTTLATISERRADRFLNAATSRGLAPFLAVDPGVESGFMMAHVTAAALASECKGLSMPACVDTIPTSAGKEDHVSMGPIAARKLERVVANLSHVLAIEAAIAARALDLREYETSPKLKVVHEFIRSHVAPWTGDRSLGRELEQLARAIASGGVREALGEAHEL